MMFIASPPDFRIKQYASLNTHLASETSSSNAGYKGSLPGSSHLQINNFPRCIASLTISTSGSHLLLESNTAAHLFFFSSFALGLINEDSKNTPSSERRAACSDDAELLLREEPTARCHIKPGAAQRGRGRLSRAAGEVPSERLQGDSEEINRASCSVTITFVFIAYDNIQHLATSVLTC